MSLSERILSSARGIKEKTAAMLTDRDSYRVAKNAFEQLIHHLPADKVLSYDSTASVLVKLNTKPPGTIFYTDSMRLYAGTSTEWYVIGNKSAQGIRLYRVEFDYSYHARVLRQESSLPFDFGYDMAGINGVFDEGIAVWDLHRNLCQNPKHELFTTQKVTFVKPTHSINGSGVFILSSPR